MTLKRCFREKLSCRWILLLSWQCVAHFSVAAEEPISIPTFSEHIAAVLYDNCIACHRPDGVGPFSLLHYGEVKRRARQIAEVVESRFMPPWKPESGHGPALIGERRLTEDEIKLILLWVEAGAPSGNQELTPNPPEFAGSWSLGEPDLVLELPVNYTLPADGDDVYRNFVIPLPFSQTRWIKALEFLPETKLAIHHAVMQADSTGWARGREAEGSAKGVTSWILTKRFGGGGKKGTHLPTSLFKL